MNLFRKRTASTPDAPGERRCRACGNALADDQLACLECGAVDAPVGGRERRWLLPTGGVIGAALFLVTSASFAANTALNTGDPATIKKQPPAVAQAPALPPASGDGTAPNSAQQDNGKGPDLGSLPGPSSGGGGGGSATPPAGSGGSSSSDSGSSSSSDSGSSNSGSGNSSSGSGSSGGSSTPPKPDKPKPPPVTIAEWPDGADGYTVVVYKFDDKAGAKAKAKEVAAKGLPAGIVDSDKYKSLDPGSWLVYIGQVDSSKEAEKAGQKYENAGYPGEVTFVGQTSTPESDPSASGSGSSTTPQP
jgi:hypothetical protein